MYINVNLKRMYKISNYRSNLVCSNKIIFSDKRMYKIVVCKRLLRFVKTRLNAICNCAWSAHVIRIDICFFAYAFENARSFTVLISGH